jgi:glucokinase
MQSEYIGVEIGGTKLQIVAGDGSGAIGQRWRFTVAAKEGGAGIRRQIETVLAKHLPALEGIKAIGTGFGGPVDWQSGKIACSHQIEGWSEFDIKTWLKKLTGLPVVIDNDANVASLGEALRGAGAGHNPVMYVTLGSGVGGGLVANGAIYHGAKPGEAEIGHVRLDRHGATVESRCSGWSVDAKIRAYIARHPESVLAKLAAGQTKGESRWLSPALAQGDEAAQTILNEVAEDLAFGLSHVTHLFHPEAIVLGGGLSLVGEPLRAAVAQSLPQFTMKAFAPGPVVRLASLGEDSVPVGALLLAAKRAAE